MEIKRTIDSLNLPRSYHSIQFRGGDKLIEMKKLQTVDQVLQRINHYGIKIKNLFVFTDDYRYVAELQKKRPEWNLFTLTGKEENGYDNRRFQHSARQYKKREMISRRGGWSICSWKGNVRADRKV